MAGTNCADGQDLHKQVGGIPHYLYAVQLLGENAEKVIGEVAQQWGVPVPIAPLAGRGHRAQHIDARGWGRVGRGEEGGQ